jgi:hypothetical protein
MARNLTKAGALVAELKSLARAAILAFVAPLPLFWGVWNCQASDLSPKRLPVLTTARAVHGLTPEQASLGYPVRIRGTVTFYDPYQVAIEPSSSPTRRAAFSWRLDFYQLLGSMPVRASKLPV